MPEGILTGIKQRGVSQETSLYRIHKTPNMVLGKFEIGLSER